MKSRQVRQRFTCEDPHAYGASRLAKTPENDCFTVYIVSTSLASCPRYIIEMNEYLFRLHQLAYCLYTLL